MYLQFVGVPGNVPNTLFRDVQSVTIEPRRNVLHVTYKNPDGVTLDFDADFSVYWPVTSVPRLLFSKAEPPPGQKFVEPNFDMVQEISEIEKGDAAERDAEIKKEPVFVPPTPEDLGKTPR